MDIDNFRHHNDTYGQDEKHNMYTARQTGKNRVVFE